MKKILRIIIFLFVNAALTLGSMLILAYFRVSDVYYPFCIYLPVLLQLVFGNNLFYPLNNINRRILTGIMILSGFVLNKFFLISEDDYYKLSDLYFDDPDWDLLNILIIYYLILILSEWFLSFNKVGKIESKSGLPISNKNDVLKVLLRLRKERKITSEDFEEEIEKLIQ